VSTSLVKHWGLPVDKTDTHTIQAANGHPMNCEGILSANITVEGQTINTFMLVTSSLNDTLVIGWRDLVKLGLIPSHFPKRHPTVQAMSSINLDTPTPQIRQSKILTSAIKSFSDVFNPNSLKPMAGPPMTINLKPDVKPQKTLTARQIPIHLAEQAMSELQKALNSGIITPEHRPTEWISPAFFVKKPNSGARLVTDFTALNKYVRRPIHPFPSARDVHRAIDPNATIFAKVDAKLGYFQIPLDDESSMLTTFLLPSGRYRYTRAPMGLSASSDELCARIDLVLQGLTGVIKIVDDILIQASNPEELQNRLYNVLSRCRKHGITLSAEKAAIGQSMAFAGLIVEPGSVRPHPDRLAAITAFPVPKDVTQLRSFLGLAVQLAHFVPDLAQMSDPLGRLLKKGLLSRGVRARLMNPWKEEGFIVSNRKRKAFFDLLNQISFTLLPPLPLPPQPRAKSLTEVGPRWQKGECECENGDVS